MSTPPDPGYKRCAIYTRKSTNDRLDQPFNSLESQREVCSAYITSQRHKGWSELPKRYDDAGMSGGSLDRRALQEVMHDLDAGLVDVVVMYKIDRLTRSLTDFVRLMEVFDRSGASFVSVTQSFDTSDSMGRLVLNILLTFAQFEREMIADRIRDKLAAMRQRGMWTGGCPPYGYDALGGKLVVNSAEAEQVQRVFRRFIELGSFTKVCQEMKRQGMKTKVWYSKKAGRIGGNIVSNGMIYNLLGNCTYIGRLKYNGQSFPGLHEPIISVELWEAAKALRDTRSMHKSKAGPSANILLGLLHDSFGRPMHIDIRQSSKFRYRYYISNQARWAVRDGVKRARSNADELERLVLSVMSATFKSREKLRAALLMAGIHGERLDALGVKGARAIARLDPQDLGPLRDVVLALITSIELSADTMKVLFRCSEMLRFIEWNGIGRFQADRSEWSSRPATFLVEVPVKALRFRRSIVMPIEPVDRLDLAHPDQKLVSLIREARKAQALVDTHRSETLATLAGRMGRLPGYFARLLRLNYLAPDIITAIWDGSQPKALTRKRLIKSNLPMDWALQREMFGIPPRPDHSLKELARYEPRDRTGVVLDR
jgi:site-specific DNA recombinase